MILIVILWLAFQIKYYTDRANGRLTNFKTGAAMVVDVVFLIVILHYFLSSL